MNKVRIESALLALVFLDLLGFGMLIPDVQIRLDSMNVPGWAIGAILSSMFVVQTLVSPLWGRFSDRIGRKPVIVVCTLLSAGAMLLYAFARDPALVLGSRILAGLGAANVAVAQAYVSDLAASGSKLTAMGRIGAAISAGLIAGPALGGVLAHIGQNFLLGIVAGSFSATGALVAWLLLPTVQPVKQEVKPKGNWDLLKTVPGLARVFLVVAVGWFSLATLEGTFGRLIKARLGLGQLEFGLIFAYESLLALVIQVALLKFVEKRWSASVALKASYVLMGVGLALFPFAPTLAMLFVASTAYATGSSVASPTANTLCSTLTPESRQGELFGLLQSARSFGFLVGPVLGGRLFDASHASPYLLATAVCLLAALVVPMRTDPHAEVPA
ncbi:MAG: MFS transporter [Armatimonadetes bacterium]|nr:MFS transporter [Armatimonadota bacterium]